MEATQKSKKKSKLKKSKKPKVQKQSLSPVPAPEPQEVEEYVDVPQVPPKLERSKATKKLVSSESDDDADDIDEEPRPKPKAKAKKKPVKEKDLTNRRPTLAKHTNPHRSKSPKDEKKINRWQQHVKEVREEHGCTYKEAMVLAKKTYKKST